MFPPILVPISAAMKEAADKYENTVLHTQNIQQNPINYTGLKAAKRFSVGHLGELCFKHVLEQSGVKFVHHVNPNGHSDNGDFVVYVKGTPNTIDVKTASSPTHKMMMFPDVTLRVHQRDAYVGVRINGDVGEVFGYITLKEARQLPVSDGFHVKSRVLTRYILLENL